MKQSLILNRTKQVYTISNQLTKEVTFYCENDNSFRTDEEIILGKFEKSFYTKNDCYHKVKELRKGHTKENKKEINVFI